MRQTLILTKKQESQLEQILNELMFSIKKTYSEEDLLSLFYSILKESGKQTYNSKRDTAAKVFKAVGKFSGKTLALAKNKVENYKNNGFQNEFYNDCHFANNQLNKAPENLKNIGISIKNKATNFNDNFLSKTKEEKIELISVGIMGILIFYASAGGEDFEGGIPDSDLNLGIGFHRHLISHSIIMGFVIEFLMRAGIEILNKSHKNLPLKHHTFWDKSNNYINKHKGIAIGAMWAGISAHLLKDSGIFGDGVKPYNGIPIELSMETHQGLFAANGTASAMFAYRDLQK
ncbi:MAG: hypothetical protein RQ864_07125 [Lutibacter sp.]|nr:hypothetical protein [Lutibacter sp.]